MTNATKLLSCEEIEAIREREQAATEGPWEIRKATTPSDGGFDFAIGAEVGGRVHCIAEVFERIDWDVTAPAEANATFINHARTDIPALLAHIEAQDALIDEQASLIYRLLEVWDPEWEPGKSLHEEAVALLAKVEAMKDKNQ